MANQLKLPETTIFVHLFLLLLSYSICHQAHRGFKLKIFLFQAWNIILNSNIFKCADETASVKIQ